MNDVAKEIMIRTVSGVLVVLIVFIVIEFLFRMKKPCGCRKDITPQPDQGSGTGEWSGGIPMFGNDGFTIRM